MLRKLNWASDYVITGGLDGPIVAADDITRSRVAIPLDFTEGVFAGGVNTTGTMGNWGRKKTMWLAARNLTLVGSK